MDRELGLGLRSLLSGQDHSLALALPRRKLALLGVLPDILLTPLNGIQFFSLNLTGLLNRLRHMALTPYPSDLRHMRVSLDQRLVIFQFRSLAGTLHSTAIGCVAAPEPDIAII